MKLLLHDCGTSGILPPALLPIHCGRPRSKKLGRGGLTLFEIVLSLAIMLGSFAALSQLIATASRAAVQSQLQNEAILRCESKMAELLAGVESLQSQSDVPFPDAPEQWVWSSVVSDGPVLDLLLLEVTVRHVSQTRPSNVQFALHRYFRDPQLFFDAAVDESVSGNSLE